MTDRDAGLEVGSIRMGLLGNPENRYHAGGGPPRGAENSAETGLASEVSHGEHKSKLNTKACDNGYAALNWHRAERQSLRGNPGAPKDTGWKRNVRMHVFGRIWWQYCIR
jgi:hypothetical protein